VRLLIVKKFLPTLKSLVQAVRSQSNAISSTLSAVSSISASAPATDEPGIRELIVPRRPYKVYYRIDNGEVWIIHIRVARRQALVETKVVSCIATAGEAP
jgi:hypothetical protein